MTRTISLDAVTWLRHHWPYSPQYVYPLGPGSFVISPHAQEQGEAGGSRAVAVAVQVEGGILIEGLP